MMSTERRTTCIVCRAPLQEAFAAREMMLGTREGFRYSCCPVCGSVTLVDPPTDWSQYYPPGSYYSMGDTGVLYAASWRRRLKTDFFLRAPDPAVALTGRLARHRRFSTPIWYRWFQSLGITRRARILDVGSGTGALLHKLAADGFSCLTGVDPFVDRSVSHSSGVRIVKGEVGGLTGTFDLIMFHHSLEHMANPLEQLKAARDLLDRGGAMLVRVPVADSWAFDHYKADWVQLDPPRHQILLTDEAMNRLAAESGLTVQRAYRDSEAFQIWGSELYRRDVKLSGAIPSEHFSSADLMAFKRESDELNGRGRGDQAVYVLKPG